MLLLISFYPRLREVLQMPHTITPEVVHVGDLEVEDEFAIKYPNLAANLQKEKTAAAVAWCKMHGKDLEDITIEDINEIKKQPLRNPYYEQKEEQSTH